MSPVFRFALALLAFLAADFFLYWMVFVQIVPETLSGAPEALALAFAAAAGWFVWRGTAHELPGLLSSMLKGALIVGSIAFLAGFVGSMIVTPEANQGPLLGLFITGPLGFLGGGVAGFLWWWLRNRRTG
jgi:hypothetical protein